MENLSINTAIAMLNESVCQSVNTGNISSRIFFLFKLSHIST